MASVTALPSGAALLKATSASADTAQRMTVSSLIAAFTTSASLLLGQLLVFSIIKRFSPSLYGEQQRAGQTEPSGPEQRPEPRGAAPPPLAELHDQDGPSFLRLLSLIVRLLAPLALVLAPVLISLNVRSATVSRSLGLDRLGWNGVDTDHASYLWAHLVGAVLFGIHFCHSVRAEFIAATRIRQRRLRSCPYGASVVLAGIPASHLRPETLLEAYNQVSGGVESIWLHRDYSVLLKKAQRRRKLVIKLEKAWTKFIVKGIQEVRQSHARAATDYNLSQLPIDSSREKPEQSSLSRVALWRHNISMVDLIEDYCAQIACLTDELSANLDENQYALSGSGIVRFQRRIDAHLVGQCLSYQDPVRFFRQLSMPLDPQDLRWGNLNLSWANRRLRGYLVLGATALLIASWAVPVALTACLFQLSYLQNRWSFMGHLPQWCLALLQGVLPQAALSLLNIAPPYIIDALQHASAPLQSTEHSLSVQRSYFVFLFLQVFFTVAMSSSAFALAAESIHGLESVLSSLAMNLPRSSNYFLSYVLLQAFSISASEVLQLSGLVQIHVLSPVLDHTPREKRERVRSARTRTWRWMYPVYTNLACIGIAYSIISPLTSLISLLAFAMFLVTFRYTSPQIGGKGLDSGGLLYPAALNQLFAGVYVQQLCLIGLFLLARDSGGHFACIGQASIMIVALIATVTFQAHMNSSKAVLLHHIPFVDDESSKGESSIAYPWSNAAKGLSALQSPVAWVPGDSYGVCEAEIARVRSRYPNLRVSNTNAIVAADGRLSVVGDAVDSGKNN